jgi:hypothetical protein
VKNIVVFTLNILTDSYKGRGKFPFFDRTFSFTGKIKLFIFKENHTNEVQKPIAILVYF